MNHYHLMVTEPNGDKRKGALATTHAAAQQEKVIEEAIGGRSAVIESCDKNCFGRSRRQAA